MGQTLFQKLLRRLGPVEYRYTNPARARVGDTFNVDVIDMRGLVFRLAEIREYMQRVNGRSLPFADYVLVAKPLGGETVARVRFVPVEAPDSDLTHNVLLLAKYDEMPYCRELHDACADDESGELVVRSDDDGEERYWRLNGVRGSYHADVSIIRDVNGDGRVETGEVEKVAVEYWDYSRDTEDEARQRFTQYLFVEMDAESGVQTLWRGVEVDPERVTVLSAPTP